MFSNRQEFLMGSRSTLEGMLEEMDKLPALGLQELQSDRTSLVIVDMVNGFAREGMLCSDRVEGIIPAIAGLQRSCKELGIAIVAFGDSHGDGSPEFKAYPPHCLTGTSEAELVAELKQVGGYEYIPKNSTNGFLEPAYQQWLEAHPQVDTYIVVGDCTDICIQQFATTLKTWFHRQDKASRVIVPLNAVETYSLGLHEAELLNLTALFMMKGNGVELVSSIELGGQANG